MRRRRGTSLTSDKLTRLLVEGRNFEAWFLASLEASRNVESDREQFRKANFNPLQPRDWRGWWTRDGFGSSIKPLITETQYRGHFHDLVVDDLLQALERGALR